MAPCVGLLGLITVQWIDSHGKLAIDKLPAYTIIAP